MPVNILQFMYDFGLLLFALLCFIYVLILLMHILMPKKLLETYFKPPYFKPAEISTFTGFPLGFIRTVMFMRIVGFPKSGIKRGLTDVYKLAPTWFSMSSRIVLSGFVVVFGLFLIILLLFFVEFFIFE